MRIVHILSQKEITGAEVYALHLAEEQKKHGHDVSIISDEIHRPTSVPVERWSVHKPRWFEKIKNIFRLRAKIKNENIHVIHGHSRAAIRLGFWATQGLPTALIMTAHGRQHFSWSKKLIDIYGQRVIGVCENIAHHLKTDFKMNSRKISVIRNPFTLPAVSSTLKKSSNTIKLSLVGRFTGPKGELVKNFISTIFPDLLKLFPQLEIDIVGKNSQALGESTLEKLKALQVQFGSRIQLLESINQLNDYYPQTDIVIGAGRVAVEALIQKKFVLALGEAQWEGLVTPDSWGQAIQSNFGDIGYPNPSSEFNFSQIKNEIENLINSISGNKIRLDHHKILNLVEQDFGSKTILQKINRLYESAWFQKQKPKNIPILMYHKVVTEEIDSPHKIFITEKQFETHLQFFKNQGFTTLTFEDLALFRTQKKPLSEFPKKPLILTFDDGYKNNLELALPLLKKYNTKAVFFLLADLNVRVNSWDKDNMPLMTAEERQQLSATNCEIGCHGFRHEKITTMTPEKAWAEVYESKKSLENEFNKKISTYAFTYGDTNLKAAELTELAGYEYAVNTDQGGLHPEENPFQVFRINIFPNDGPSQLRKKTASWYRKYYFYKRGK